MINDPTENLHPHINKKQVNNVVKTIQKNLNSQNKYYWKNNDVFLRNAVINKMKYLGYDVELQGKLIIFQKDQSLNN
jgi:hypothetical protein